MTKVFISYSHKQSQWVQDRLVPCLEAGGAEILIDRDRFQAGRAVVGQMDQTQDQAEKHVLVLSEEYLASRYCKHEMNRAVKLDPRFEQGVVVPVKRGACTLPAKISRWNPPLYVDLQDDKQADPWGLLLDACDADLGTAAPDWLAARDAIVRFLDRGQSVNLVVRREPKWRELLDHVARDQLPELALVNLENPDTNTRRGLLATISQALGDRTPLPEEPGDLPGFKNLISNRSGSMVGLMHFDLAPYRSCYDVDLFAALRYFIMDARSLVLLVESRTPFASLLPHDHPLSAIDIKTVELGVQ